MFQKTVRTGTGAHKTVTALTREELDEGLAAVRAETPIVAVDITNPQEANFTMEQFQARADAKLKAEREGR